MCGHIIVAFHIVPVRRICVWRPPLGQHLKVVSNGRIRVLGNHQGATGVLDKDMRNTNGDAGPADDGFKLGGDICRAAAAGLNLNNLLVGHPLFFGLIGLLVSARQFSISDNILIGESVVFEAHSLGTADVLAMIRTIVASCRDDKFVL